MNNLDELLGNIRVVDMATERAEMAGRVLADFGAEVIKVEPPGGSTARTMPPFAEDGSEPHSLYWSTVGLGKKSVVLDPANASDRARLLRLVATADVFIESDDPGVLPGLGLGYADLQRINPRLVYVSVTPYGQDGPEAHSPASELVLEAACGRVSCQGDADRAPAPLGYPQTAFHAGVQAAADAVFALYERQRSGLGQHLDVSTQAVMVWTLLHSTGYPALGLGDAPGSGPNRAARISTPISRSLGRQMAEAKDGWLTMSLGLGPIGATTSKYLMDWAIREGAISERFHDVNWATWQVDFTTGKLDAETLEAAGEELFAFVKTKTKRELMDRASNDILFLAPVYSIADVVADPHLIANDFWVRVGDRIHPGPVAHLDNAPLQMGSPAPALGADQSLLDDLPPLPAPAAAPPVSHELQGSRILEGIKVADFSWLGVGPITGKSLADHGATVVRIESETRPDLLRYLGPFAENTPGLNRSQFYGNFNSSKLSAAINIGMDEGRDLARKMIEWADVVLESFRPGAMARIGIDYETMSRTKPGLIMYSTCIRGQVGPERFFPGTGAQGAALCGMVNITGWPDRQPCNVHGAYTDVIVPRYGAALIAASLLYRDRTGKGQHIDISQVAPGVRFLEPLMLDYTVNGRIAGRMGQAADVSAPRGVYRTRGTERFVAIEVTTAAQWQALRSVAPLDAFSAPEFDELAVRIQHREAIDAALIAWAADQEAEPLAAKLKATGVPASVAYFPSELYEEPQLKHRDFFVPLQHPEMGLVKYDGLATRFSRTPGKLSKAAPCIGEDTQYVLSELLGISDDQIAEYAGMGVLA